jgi:hypothetical protein
VAYLSVFAVMYLAMGAVFLTQLCSGGGHTRPCVPTGLADQAAVSETSELEGARHM